MTSLLLLFSLENIVLYRVTQQATPRKTVSADLRLLRESRWAAARSPAPPTRAELWGRVPTEPLGEQFGLAGEALAELNP